MNKIQKLKDGREFLTKNGTFIPEKGEEVYFVEIDAMFEKVVVLSSHASYDHAKSTPLSSFNRFRTKEDAEKAAVIIRAALGE
jgi:hypothetical protein